MKAPGAGAAPAVELDGSDDVVRTYTWGLDLAGLHTANSGPGRRGYPTSGGFLQAAGGIGGLLAVYDADASDGYVSFHDANGNVGQVVAWENGYGGASGDDWHADRLVAKYEYSPFGEVVGPDDDADGDWRDDAGAFATDNPFRFSTKWFDDAIGVSDFGARMYSATLGRFLNRDPIAEAGGVNLYAFVANNPVNYVDPFGYHVIPCPSPGSCGWDVGSQDPLFGGGVPVPGAGGDGDVAGSGGPAPNRWGWKQHPRSCYSVHGELTGEILCGAACAAKPNVLGLYICPPEGRPMLGGLIGDGPCFCICADRLANDPTAQEIAEGCVSHHEVSHMDSDPDCTRGKKDNSPYHPLRPLSECGVLVKELMCILRNMHRCGNNLLCRMDLTDLARSAEGACNRTKGALDNPGCEGICRCLVATILFLEFDGEREPGQFLPEEEAAFRRCRRALHK